MKDFYSFNNPSYNPYLYLSSGGIDQTKPRHVYGPAGRSGYMIHYVERGEGYFTSNTKRYHLSSGSFFFIEPSQIIKMEAAVQEPWKLQWIRYTGKLADIYMNKINISYQRPIFSISDHHAQIILDNLLAIIEFSHMNQENDFIFESKLLTILDQLALMYPKDTKQNKNAPNKLFTQGIQFIHNNFETPITIEDVVDYLSIDRTYLFKIFKKELGISPQNYLIKCRIRKARQLLSTTKIRLMLLRTLVVTLTHYIFLVLSNIILIYLLANIDNKIDCNLLSNHAGYNCKLNLSYVYNHVS